MAALPLEPTARYRKSRTRSRNTAFRPVLAVSALGSHQYDLRPSCASLICPDCKTWVPITGIKAKRQKIVPHDTGVARKDAAARCQGSNRLVSVDVPFEVWQRRLEDGSAETAGRSSGRQHYEPPAPALKPISRMSATQVSADNALTSYAEHIKKCQASRTAECCVGSRRCAEGARLASLYEQLKRSQPHRDRELEDERTSNALLARHRAAMARRRDTAEWTQHHESTAGTQPTAKRSGTAIEELSNVCRIPPPGAVSEFRSPDLPLGTYSSQR
ncbi:hypothetical protein ACFWFI_05705 [Streptomyces sp. NPDC060209]|uniref:hypothetical protein n=1 Tax=Streptomyces sp. NPDC060209 TaxID=3347073 RepID=UPI0036635DB6